MKKFIGLVIVLMLCSLAVFTSCDDLFRGTQEPAVPVDPPAAPASLTAVAGVEEVDVSWSASEGAVSYNLYYTINDTAPAKTSTKITLGNVTTYTLPNLTWAKSGKTYRFAVAAVKSGIEGALSTVSNSIRPIPTIEVRFTGGTANAKMMLMVTPVNMDRTGATPELIDFDTGVLYTGFTTNASGAVYLKAPFNREKSVGFTLMYDVDESNSLTEGDIVQGNGAAKTWGIYYWDDLDEASFYTDQPNGGLTWHEYLP